ncbi:hypothetical protein GQ55_8G099600 [Panicum hallii var. hallii]|uniref:Uncharacterized protein n=1 Tax=Panicum hallii var. hallii TaxID=1504633 RepID=A0A2T7CM93_9POAL|nr:hypothetical protein GQ55_8G099600 [Panicum hallii var. hallii]
MPVPCSRNQRGNLFKILGCALVHFLWSSSLSRVSLSPLSALAPTDDFRPHHPHRLAHLDAQRGISAGVEAEIVLRSSPPSSWNPELGRSVGSADHIDFSVHNGCIYSGRISASGKSAHR